MKRITLAFVLALLVGTLATPAGAHHNTFGWQVPANITDNETSPKWDTSIFLSRTAGVVRDFTSYTTMVAPYTVSCYPDLDIPLRQQFKEGICYLKSEDIWGTSSQFNPYNRTERDTTAIFYARLGRYLDTLSTANGNWVTSINGSPVEGCVYFSDVSCSNGANGAIGQLYINNVTEGCATSPRRFCPGALITHAQNDGWHDQMISRMD